MTPTAICWDADQPEASALVAVQDDPDDLAALLAVRYPGADVEVHATLGGAQRALRKRLTDVAAELLARTDNTLARLARLDLALGIAPDAETPDADDAAWARFTEHPTDPSWPQ
jgi:hypothetical protein